MKPKFLLFLLFCIIGTNIHAQTGQHSLFNIGDPAPPLRIKEWIKGPPIKDFEKGKVYVVEFWATWCRPCMAAMPHLSRLARKYRHKATFLAIDVYESRGYKPASLTKVKDFVDSMRHRMDCSVAIEDNSFTVHDWLDNWGETDNGIPRTFVVDKQGRISWIGYPNNLDTVLKKIANDTWDIKVASSTRIFNRQWAESDFEVIEKTRRYQDNYDHLEDVGYPDSILLIVNKMVKERPDLKYAPWMVSYTFSALLLSDPQKAYAYGKAAITTTTYDGPAYGMIISDILDDSRKINIPPEIYQLGAECYQGEIDHLIYPELHDRAKLYRKMAEWYRLAGDKQKAIKAEKKALRLYKKGK